ncbi:hypothetical protein J6590_059075 [Homalodisca vitripennis]|nr:hypothetical protein J6590_059075 [Homalodisca vitripennis]
MGDTVEVTTSCTTATALPHFLERCDSADRCLSACDQMLVASPPMCASACDVTASKYLLH